MKRLLAAATLFLGFMTSVQAATLDDVKVRGTLNCGVNPNLHSPLTGLGQGSTSISAARWRLPFSVMHPR